MRLDSKKNWIFYFISSILIADLLYLTAITSEVGFMNYPVRVSGNRDVRTSSTIPRLLNRLYYLTGYIDKDYLHDFETSLTMTHNYGDYRNVIARNLNILLPVVCFGIFAYYLGLVIKRKKRQIAIMAISIGGHAPPVKELV